MNLYIVTSRVTICCTSFNLVSENPTWLRQLWYISDTFHWSATLWSKSQQRNFKKAFDLINHEILLSKFSAYNIGEKEVKLLTNCPSGRLQYVNINGMLSQMKPVQYGVPQGSVLFLIFVNDLPAMVQHSTIDMWILQLRAVHVMSRMHQTHYLQTCKVTPRESWKGLMSTKWSWVNQKWNACLSLERGYANVWKTINSQLKWMGNSWDKLSFKNF